MTSYITGSNGFLGSHLVKHLPDAICVEHDLIRVAHLQKYDYFYFLSTYGNLATHTDQDKIFKANIEDLLTVLKKSKDINFKSFVFISTSSVKLRTQTTYSRAKKAAEEILLAYMEKNNAPICIIRPFSITGVGEQKEHLIPTLIDAAFTGKTINFVPWATHDYIDVEDVIEGILNLSQHGARGIFELGSGEKYTNQEVMHFVEQATGKPIAVNYVDNLRAYDNDSWQSNNFKARSFGWLPKKQLTQSITEMVEAYVTK